jgi:pyruvate formate lyase activating enzyme
VTAAGLPIGGLIPFSSVDFPGRLAAVLFTQGCPLRCRYCHNTHLRPRNAVAAHDWGATLDWLRRRRGLLDAVVFSGGEPTLHVALPDAIASVRDLGFAIGLHSAGAMPGRLAAVLEAVDWVGLDFKAPFARYQAVTGSAASGDKARQALDTVLGSGVAYELRTTLHPALLGDEDLLAMAEELRARGVRRWVIQRFRATGCGDDELVSSDAPGSLEERLPELRRIVPEIVIR